MCNFRGECAPLINPTGGLFCHPYKSMWEVPRNNPHHLAKFYTPCKSQLQNAWPVSPTTPCRLISEFPSKFQSPLNLRYTGFFLLISSPLSSIALLHSSSLFSTSSLLVLHNTMSSSYNIHHGDQNEGEGAVIRYPDRQLVQEKKNSDFTPGQTQLVNLVIK